MHQSNVQSSHLLDLLLRPQLVAVATFLFPAVDSSGMQACITFAANHFVLIVLPSQLHQGWLNNTTTKPQNQMEGRFFLDIVVSKSAAILELLSSKDQSLLVRRNTFLILDLSLDIVDGIAGFDLEGDGLPG